MSEQKQKIRETEEAPLSSRKKRAMLEYLGIMFAVAFLLVALSLLVKVHTMQDDLDAANSGARENIEEMEAELETARSENEQLRTELDTTVRSAKAAELLALAQNAWQTQNTVSFHGYMAELEGYADALSDETAQLYDALLDKLP